MRIPVLVIFCLLVFGAGWGRALQWGAFATRMREVAWEDADGLPVRGASRGPGCHPDINLVTLGSGPRIYTTCTGGERYPGGALASVDPARGEGRIAWPMPAELPLIYSEGLLPGDDGFGYVYRTPDFTLAVAIAGAEGWRVAPRALPAGHLMGMAWVGGALEVAIRPDASAAGLPPDPVVVRLDGGGWQERSVPACAPGQDTCVTMAAQHRDGVWHWFVPQFLLDGQEPQMLDVSEGRVFAAWPYSYDFHGTTDLTRIGHFIRPRVRGLALVELAADGQFLATGAAPDVGYRMTGNYEVVGGVLRHRDAHWDDVAQARVTTLGARTVSIRKATDDALVVADPGIGSAHVVARVASSGTVHQGVFLPRSDGGHWLVNPDGTYIALSEGLERLDPLGLVEHLRQRGSLLTRDEPRHGLALAWALFGLPLLLFVGALRARFSSGRFALSAPALLFYAVTGAVALASVYPLLN